MTNKMNRSNLFYGIIALLFSLILFFNANGNKIGSSLMASSEDFEETVTKVQIHPTYDDTKYFVHGFDPYVTVKLKSPNRIQLNTEVNPDTRNFRVVADLSNFTEGTHQVKLRIQNESSGMSYSIDPSTITVTIEKRVSKTFKVEPVVNSSNLGEGFTLGEVTVNPEAVKITTGDKTLAQINKVVATVDPSKSSETDFEEAVNVKALDKDQNSLSIIADPVQVTVKVKVVAPEKEIGLYTSQTGTVPSAVSHYFFTLAKTTATISGPLNKINEIESLPVGVDVTNITETTTKEMPVQVPEGVHISQAAVKVTITPVAKTSQSTNNAGSGNNNTQPSSTQQSEPKTTSSSSEEPTAQSSSKEPTQASKDTAEAQKNDTADSAKNN